MAQKASEVSMSEWRGLELGTLPLKVAQAQSVVTPSVLEC